LNEYGWVSGGASMKMARDESGLWPAQASRLFWH